MKNTKAILLIVLGSFIIATGFAFAENVSYGQLEEYSKSITIPAPDLSGPGTNKDAIVNEKATTVAAAPAATPPAVAPAAPVKPEPTFMEKAKKYVGDNLGFIVSAAAIGFIAMLVIGTGGAGLLVGLLAFGLLKFIS